MAAAKTKKKIKRVRRHVEARPKTKLDAFPTNEISTSDSYLFLNRVTPYNPDDLAGKKGLTVYGKMLKDEQVKAALFAKQFAVLASGWEIVPPKLPEGEQEMADSLKRFVEFNFGEMEGGTLDSNLLEIMTGLAYGFSVTERVYRLIDYGEFNGRVGLKAMKTRRPENFDFGTDPYGNLEDNGVIQSGTRLPADRFIIWSYRKTYNNFYGNSDLREAYRPWFIKDQVLRFMTITLERYGEPIVIFTHSGNITPAQRSTLESIISGFQSKTGLVLPQGITADFKSPDVKVSDAYVPAIAMLDTSIGKAILMPSLLGMTPEGTTGSLARAQQEFDVFLWIVSQLRIQISETVMNDQVIKPLVDLNFEVTGGNYPLFRFKGITEEQKQTLFGLYLDGVKTGGLTKTREDENQAREMIGFNPLPEDEQIDNPEDNPDDVPPDDNDEPDALAEKFQKRQMTRYEKRVDFQAVQRVLDIDTFAFEKRMRAVLTKVRNDIVDWAESVLDDGELTPSMAAGFSVDDVSQATELQKIANEMLTFVWRKGRDTALKELPPKLRRSIQNIKTFDAGFSPDEAINAFESRAWLIKAVIDDEIKKQARQELFRHLEKGRTTLETIGNLRAIFEPYIGDPTKIKPSGPGVPAGSKILEAFRLENIVRTESAWAMNQGRLAVGDAADEFVIGYQFSSILDTRTTKVCLTADGLIIKKDDARLKKLTPGLHYQCRSILVMVTQEDLPVKFSTSAAINKAVALIQKGFS